MDTFKIVYTVLGGLGIFFFGMKMMSEALQQAAGSVITKVINSLTTNRVLAVTVGMIVTMIVQSSSVTTVMTVGFVNAGLMNLTQAIGVIFGSNIGTTITGWIISIKVGKYGLLLIGLGIFPVLFSKNKKWQTAGRVTFGIGMIFFGLQIMSGAFKPLRSNPEFLEMISYFSDQTYQSYFASIMVGCLLTVIIQSSSAMLGITIALASTGIISFHTAAALVLGENIGTTITALLASVGTSVNAKRAARAHAFFNVFGVVLIFIVLPQYVEFIEWLVPGDSNMLDAEGGKPNIATHIAASHTFFNITASLVFLPFLGHLARFVTKITPDTEDKMTPHLKMIGEKSEILPATAIVQADAETMKMKDILDRMFRTMNQYIEVDDVKKLAKIHDYERITDNIQKEVTVYLCKVMEKPLSSSQSRQCQAIIKIVDEIESIADYLDRITNYTTRLHKGEKFDADSLREFNDFKNDVWAFYQLCIGSFIEKKEQDMDHIIKKSEELRILANDMRERNLERISKGGTSALSALTYSDMVVALRKVRAHAMNIAHAMTMYNK